MKTKSPLTKNEIIKDFKTGNLFIYFFIFLGIIGVGSGIGALFFLPLLSLLFIPAFGIFFIYLPLKMQKKANEDLSSIQNDNFQVIEDRILEKDHKITSHKDKDGDLDYRDSYYIVGVKTDNSFPISEDEYKELKTGDFFYYGCINHDSFTREFLASEWYVDPSLQPLFVPWSKDDEELFVKKTAATENQ